MGLNTSFNAWDGPYSSFNEWRKWVAKHVDIHLPSMIGFGGTIEWDQNLDLYPLLHHSDCEGLLTVEECVRIKRGLLIIFAQYKDVADKLTIYDKDGYEVDKLKNFINGCSLAIENNEPIIFG